MCCGNIHLNSCYVEIVHLDLDIYKMSPAPAPAHNHNLLKNKCYETLWVIYNFFVHNQPYYNCLFIDPLIKVKQNQNYHWIFGREKENVVKNNRLNAKKIHFVISVCPKVISNIQIPISIPRQNYSPESLSWYLW